MKHILEFDVSAMTIKKIHQLDHPQDLRNKIFLHGQRVYFLGVRL